MNRQGLSRSRRRFSLCKFTIGFTLILFSYSTSIFAISEDSTKATSWKITIASKDEPGESLIVSGTIYGADGKTPLPGVTLFVYHTDAEGYYRKGDNGSSNPRLKGSMTTNADGKYEFRTIKPGSYPGSRNPSHVHAKAWGAGHPEQWIDEFRFQDDPYISDRDKQREASKGRFASIMAIQRGADGVLRCARDIKLER
jgi:protocatechuate 3,4-dioxygenase beta subunit